MSKTCHQRHLEKWCRIAFRGDIVISGVCVEGVKGTAFLIPSSFPNTQFSQQPVITRKITLLFRFHHHRWFTLLSAL
ncbi:hypothetical protein P4S72_25165 [Vibrio sp. PP-XX7]